MHTPPTRRRSLETIVMSVKIYPSRDEDTPNIPIKDVSAIVITPKTVVSIRSSAGLKQNT